jgi:hypothetical protein
MLIALAEISSAAPRKILFEIMIWILLRITEPPAHTFC